MPVTLTEVNLEQLSRRYAALQLRCSALQGRAQELQEQRKRLTKNISLAKARMELAPQATEVFNYLQERAHARAVGEFEDLLSAFVADVVPDAGKICLELGTERGAPALDILLDNGGDKENILEGNGGGLTNVVVTGLGFSALSRTANRQLMLLDEPDCWLKDIYVPSFTKVIAEVSNPRLDEDGEPHAGCQTLMISHNEVSLMDEGAHIQELRREFDLQAFADRLGVSVSYNGEVGDCAYVVWATDSKGVGRIEVRYREDGLGDEDQNALTKGFPYAYSVAGSKPWSSDMPGVRWVEVANLRRHVFTRLELSPGLNVLAGDINGGKSTLYFTALRAMAYGDTDDAMIRHGADSAVVRLGLENDVVLEMVRSRKGSPKVLYRRYEGGRLTNEGRQETRGGVPDFISSALNIARVDGLDIQLRSQKQPIFLLNESPARRAQLLSVGRESGLLQALIERHRLQLRRDREEIKRDEIELNLANRTLTVLAPVASMVGLRELLDALLTDARLHNTQVHATRALVARMTPLESRVWLLQAFASELSVVVSLPEVFNTQRLRDVLAHLEPLRDRSALHRACAAELAQALALPVVTRTQPLTDLMARIERNQALANLPELPSSPTAPVLAATPALTGVMTVLHRGQQAKALLAQLVEAPVVPAVRDTAQIRLQGVALRKKLDSVTELAGQEKEALTEATAAEEALHAIKHQLGVCPTCQQTFPESAHV